MIEPYDIWYDEKLICFYDGVLAKYCDNCPFIKECNRRKKGNLNLED